MAIKPRDASEIESAVLHVAVNPTAPSRFATFTMDSIGISDTRSLHNDTEFVHLSATVGANATVFVSKSLGDLNNGTHSVWIERRSRHSRR
jgi:hypothetical protein